MTLIIPIVIVLRDGQRSMIMTIIALTRIRQVQMKNTNNSNSTKAEEIGFRERGLGFSLSWSFRIHGAEVFGCGLGRFRVLGESCD